MSNGIRFDSLLVRELALELHGLLSGRPLRALAFHRESWRVDMRLDDLDMTWQLHPDRGLVTTSPPAHWKGNIPVAHGSHIRSVEAPTDERILDIDVDAGDAAARGHVRLVIIELMPQRWNAFALGAARRVTAMLRIAPRRALVLGEEYRSPRPAVRVGGREALTVEEWLRLLLPTPPVDRRRRLLDAVAYTSPINASYILGDAVHDAAAEALREAFQRYREVVVSTARQPCLLAPADEAQPYSHPLGTSAAVITGSLLAAFGEAARIRSDSSLPAPSAAALARDALDAVRTRIKRIDGRVARLRQELEGAPDDAANKRRWADMLLSQMQNVPRGAEFVDLDDFAGGLVRVPLDPTASPAENAQRLYDMARKRDRAARQLPGLIERAHQERLGLDELTERINNGTASDEEMRAAARLDTTPQRRTPAQGSRLPYRRYFTSGGCEVRVGRSSAANDELTFRHSALSDIWLHARDVAGAHVVLRWNDREANPPAADLAEAAALAALHSRARTSGAVPVDWTRRKYVRKPRGSRPGSVVIERAHTLFVEPDENLEKRLRKEENR